MELRAQAANRSTASDDGSQPPRTARLPLFNTTSPRCPALPLPTLQEQQAGAGVALWVTVPHIDWAYVSSLGFAATDKWLAHSDALLVAAVQEAVAAGFPLQGKPEG